MCSGPALIVPTAMLERHALRAAAVFEAFKGAVVLVAALGLPLLAHHNLGALAASLVAHTHLNPASRYPRIFVDAAAHLQNTHLVLLSLGALAYAALRFVAAYGLLRGAAWAEVLAAASGAVYVPLEAAELLRHATWLRVGALGANLAVVAVMLAALHRRRREARACGEA